MMKMKSQQTSKRTSYMGHECEIDNSLSLKIIFEMG